MPDAETVKDLLRADEHPRCPQVHCPTCARGGRPLGTASAGTAQSTSQLSKLLIEPYRGDCNVGIEIPRNYIAISAHESAL